MIAELYRTPAVPYPCLQKSVKEVEQRLPYRTSTSLFGHKVGEKRAFR